MSAFDARRRYLTGLGITPTQAYRKRRLLAFDPRRRYLSAFDSRRRYLTGLGDDDSFPSLGPYTPIDQPTIDYGVIDTNTQMAETGAGVGPLATPTTSSIPASLTTALTNFLKPTVTPGSTIKVTPSTAAAQANSLAPTTPAGASWFSQTNPTLGISNGTLALGLAGVGLLVLLGGRRR
jgi:hypothetical protein